MGRGLGAAVYGASEGLDTLIDRAHRTGRTSRHVTPDRELPRLSGRDQRNRAHEPRGHPGPEVRRASGDALPRGLARTGEPAPRRATRSTTTRSPRAPSSSRPAPTTGASPSTASPTTRATRSSTRRDRPRGGCAPRLRVGVVGGGNSAGQAAVWLARGGALVTLLHRRADLRETMSDYLVRQLERNGVAIRDRSEIVALHGGDGSLEAVTLEDGEQLPLSFLFLFLGAQPCTEWLGDTVARDEKGFILTGSEAEGRSPARDERPRRLRRRRRPLRLDQAVRDGGRRGRDGRPVRPRAPRPRRRRFGLMEPFPGPSLIGAPPGRRRRRRPARRAR